MTGGDEPVASSASDEKAWKELPTHMIGYAHHRHDGEDDEQGAVVNGNEEDEEWNDHCPGDRFEWMEAHRGPGCRRPAGMVDGVGGAKEAGPMHQAMSPVEPAVVSEQI
jgi:hypothetical protein